MQAPCCFVEFGVRGFRILKAAVEVTGSYHALPSLSKATGHKSVDRQDSGTGLQTDRGTQRWPSTAVEGMRLVARTDSLQMDRISNDSKS